MIRLPVPPIPSELIETVRRSVQAGKPQEEVFAQMRELGLHIGHSIKLTQELYGIPLVDAKQAVHFSQTWADCLGSNDATHEAAFEAVRQLGGSQVEVDLHSEPAELLQPTR